MGTYIIADNQELTAFAVESLLSRNLHHTLLHAHNKTELLTLLKQHEHAVVLLDYTLFDFGDEESLLIVSERFAMTRWILLSDELSEKFLRRIVYASHRFSVVFKDQPMKALRDALAYADRDERYISQRATEMILLHQQEYQYYLCHQEPK